MNESEQILINTIRGVYNHLADDESKKIFTHRLLFSLTEDTDFLNSIFSSNAAIIRQKHPNLASRFLDVYQNKLMHRNVVLYGAGYYGVLFTQLCESVSITAFCDGDNRKQKSTFIGYDVISPEELRDKYPDSCIIIAVLAEKSHIDIQNTLLKLGFSEKNIIIFKEFLEIEGVFSKYLSQYFASDIVKLDGQEEVFIDAGCFDCYTSKQFKKWCGDKYEKIIAFEPNPNQYPVCVEDALCMKDMTVYPYGLWHENTEISFDNSIAATHSHVSESSDGLVKIKAITLDSFLCGDKATFIKMDIEGAELNALKGAAQTIIKHRPKLAICVYHKPEDIWEIPQYILSLVSDYELYLRHYSCYPAETVLYAV